MNAQPQPFENKYGPNPKDSLVRNFTGGDA